MAENIGDELLVPKDPVSENPVSENPVQEPGSEPAAPAAEPSPAELLKQLNDLKADLTKQTEEAKRSIQSAKDRARAEVEAAQRRALVAENTLSAAQRELAEADPGMARDLELAKYRAQQENLTQLQQQQALAAQRMSFHQKFVDSISESLKEIGIDPGSKDLDWGEDAPDYMEAQKRVLKSAAKLHKTNQETQVKELNKQIKDLQFQIRRLNGEADSVDTTNPAGSGSESDKDFIAKFANGDVPMTKANVARYHKIVGL